MTLLCTRCMVPFKRIKPGVILYVEGEMPYALMEDTVAIQLCEEAYRCPGCGHQLLFYIDKTDDVPQDVKKAKNAITRSDVRFNDVLNRVLQDERHGHLETYLTNYLTQPT